MYVISLVLLNICACLFGYRHPIYVVSLVLLNICACLYPKITMEYKVLHKICGLSRSHKTFALFVPQDYHYHRVPLSNNILCTVCHKSCSSQHLRLFVRAPAPNICSQSCSSQDLRQFVPKDYYRIPVHKICVASRVFLIKSLR